jgi:DNA primase
MKIPYPVPDEILQTIRQNISIMELIRTAGIKYWKAGVNKYKIRSFRNFDKNPSLIIYENKNDFYDFSANVGGDVIQFYMEMTSCNFRQAVRELAEMCFSGDFEHEKGNLRYKVRLNDYNLAIEEFHELLQFIMSLKSKTKHLKFVREMIKEVKNKIAREELAEADNQAEKV